MNAQNTTTSILVAVMLLTATFPTFSQTRGEEEKRWEEKENRNWFWELIFGSGDNDTWDNSVTINDEDLRLAEPLARYWQFSIGDNEKWASPSYNDSNWERIYVPSKWENEGFNGYDGYAWYRIHFDGRKLNAKQVHYLVLGFVDDVDETFLNGTMIGKSGTFPPRFRTAFNSNRKYYIPNEVMNFNGDNVVAVRVYDETLDGGIIRGKPGVYTSRHSEELLQNLYGPWKFMPANSSQYSNPDYDDSDWENLMVPSHWDNQGYRSFDGTAWYRKTFELDFVPEKGKVYYLVLGKIDDFDTTYLNGERIGSTNDGRRFGDSHSYDKLRIYEIPTNLLKKGKNKIAVKVTDLGNPGGIYKGPIGIVEESGVTRIFRNEY